MASSDAQIQLVTFQLGEELYGINIMGVKEIVRVQEIRSIPSAPYYVEGILNLRRQIIPIINLHKRFRLQRLIDETGEDEFEGGFIILDINGTNIGVIIDRISRVVSIDESDIKPPPQMLSGIGSEYIRGVIKRENSNGYIIMLDINRLFDPKELQKIIDVR